MNAFLLPCGEIDYTGLPDVIRLFVQTGSHPGNVKAFVAKNAAKQKAYEDSRAAAVRWTAPLGPPGTKSA